MSIIRNIGYPIKYFLEEVNTQIKKDSFLFIYILSIFLLFILANEFAYDFNVMGGFENRFNSFVRSINKILLKS